MSILSGILGGSFSGGNSSSLSPSYLLEKIKTVDGSGSGLDADVLDGYHASHFASQVDLANVQSSLQSSILNVEQKINNIFPILSRVIFKEEFFGNGSSSTFTLSGNIKNSSFSSGSWNISQVIITKQAHITDEDGKPIYNSTIPLLKQRILIDNISSSGVVTLNYAPLNGQKFYIWYWYQLSLLDSLSFYERDDFVAQIEEEGTKEAWNVNVFTGNFGGSVLNNTHNTVQKALEQIDSSVSTLISNTQNITGGLSQLNNTFVKKGGDTFSGSYTLSGSSSILIKSSLSSDYEVSLSEQNIFIKNNSSNLTLSGGKISFDNEYHLYKSGNRLNLETENYFYEFRKSGILRLKNISCEDIESTSNKIMINGINGSLQASNIDISDVATKNYVDTQVATKQDPITLNQDVPIISITKINNTTWNFSHNGFPYGNITNPGIKFSDTPNSGFSYQYINSNSGKLFTSIAGNPILTLDASLAEDGYSRCKLIANELTLANENNYSIPISTETKIIFSDSTQNRWQIQSDITSIGIDSNGIETGRNLRFVSYNNSASLTQVICSISRDINGYFDIFNRLRLSKSLNLFSSTINPIGISAGELYYNTSNNELRVFNGSTWQSVGSGSFSGFPDGSASSPSIYFTEQTNLGFYRLTQNVIAVGYNGTRVWSMDGNGIMSFVNGPATSAFTHPYNINNVIPPRIQSRITKSNDLNASLANIIALAQHDPDNGGFGPSIVLARSKGSTSNNYAIVASNDNLGSISFQASNGNNRFAQAARIHSVVTGTPATSATSIPASLIFETNNVEAMRITHQQRVGIGISNPSCVLHIVSTDTLPTPSANEVLIGGGQIRTGGNIVVDRSHSGVSGVIDIRTQEWQFTQIRFFWLNTQMGSLEINPSGHFNVVGPSTNNAILNFLCGPTFLPYVTCKNEVGVKIYSRSNDPTSGLEEGFMYYNTSTKKLRIYNGSSWVDV